MNQHNFANNLERIMQERKISQSNLARKSGIHQSQLSRMFAGKRTHIRIDTICAILIALDLKFEELAK